MCIHVGDEPGGDEQGGAEISAPDGQRRLMAPSESDAAMCVSCGGGKGKTRWTRLCLIGAPERDVEGVKFPSNSPTIPPGAAPSCAGAGHTPRMARPPARTRVSAVTGGSSAVGWQVRGDIVERERILRGWTRTQLTEAADIDPKTLRDLLSARRHPTLGTVGTLCRALDVPLADVIAIMEQPRSAGRVARVGRGTGQEAAQALLPLE